LKKHKPWFDEGCSKLLDKRKKSQLQWLQDPRTTNSKNKNIRDLYRGIDEFKKGYQPRSDLVKNENGDLLADSHSILNR
jgi:hypothetical protein